MEDEEEAASSSASKLLPTTTVSSASEAVGKVVWSVGSRLESKARDSNGGEQWFPAKVLEVEAERILVHYMQWNARHDEWIPVNSSRLRPVTNSGRSSRHNSGGASGDLNEVISNNSCSSNFTGVAAITTSTTTTTTSNNATTTMPLPAHKDFKPGDKVMATWKLNRKYLATVRKFEPSEGTYLVEFYDGVQCRVKPNNMRKPRKGEEADHQQETLKVNGVDNESAENSDIEDSSNSGPTSNRRERKRKFDVKQLLNIRSVKSLRSNSQEESVELNAPKNEKRKRRMASQKSNR